MVFFSGDEEACDTMVRPVDRTEPSKNVSHYDAYYAHYQKLYPALASTFAELAKTVAQGD
jgi:sugar (pentulose or hexulose) kinase